jgi:cardiolipin synthase (CMP-forming)
MINSNIYAYLTVSTLFTLSRIIMVPFIVWSMATHAWGTACVLFTVAALTDVIDGALARFLKEETILGAYLDPLADKLLVLSCYGALMVVDFPPFTVPVWFVLVLFLKELLLVVGAFYIGIMKNSLTIRPTVLGKTATVMQIAFIWWLFASAFFNIPGLDWYTLFLIVIMALTLGALFHYAYIAYSGYKGSRS